MNKISELTVLGVDKTNFMEINMKELTFGQLNAISGGDRGDATAGGGIATGIAAGGYAASAARGAGYGARVGAIFGVAGFIGGAIVGGAAGFILYSVSK
ncbi:hypothetical protein [Rheinheimera sp.]|uniref:hypothetical protein n=1 Tax=Rheinheimera sp. TaxID=1869214 RepID=UPI002356F6F0|nr:hypothetical protein [Rheinheimera sp.]